MSIPFIPPIPMDETLIRSKQREVTAEYVALRRERVYSSLIQSDTSGRAPTKEPRRQDLILHGPIVRESWAEFLFWTSLRTLPRRRGGSSANSSGPFSDPSGDGGAF
ncbi:MAG: hypothetical protein Q4P78_07930 [Rothia sp. (in: high G+C Gram-positive bacteria)]|uniref:hypothetical protein n=1 Tax=Rothia sp. (in: high G+C Gram-positive bacteria) TaxID=1885016 RepID=UPI0026E02CE5|nr:hypothetical protein [Rothia sp. (in: high G+C Gram-positive bacteria)]MDO5751107.1 hypothetical protein [Rothia sp. (in: high G+C Gram-positive bacteria)]